MLKEEKIKKILQSENVNLSLLRKESWRKCPLSLRGQVWRLLWEYEPSKRRRSNEFLAMKRREYYEMAEKIVAVVNDDLKQGSEVFEKEMAEAEKKDFVVAVKVSNTKTTLHPLSPRSSTMEERDIWRQIALDIPRTSPTNPLFKKKWISDAMTRILYLLSIRRPLTGYVQGMNDLLTPFIWVFYWEQKLDNYLHDDDDKNDDIFDGNDNNTDDDNDDKDDDDDDKEDKYKKDNNNDKNKGNMAKSKRKQIEADSFWCLCRLIDEVQPNYTPLQSGIIEQIDLLEILVKKEDPALHQHITDIGVSYLQISFRWFNCLLIREFSLEQIVQMWSAYLAEGGPGSFGRKFHPHVCSSFLIGFSEKLREMDFQDFVTFLQQPQTASWGEEEVDRLMSQSFISSRSL